MASTATQQQAWTPQPKPFLKWAGGKTQLLSHILARFPDKFRRYHEPFLGGGAVFFALDRRHTAHLSDVNSALIHTYQAIRDDLPGLLKALRKHQASEEHYYYVRSIAPASLAPTRAAARTIFLNRTCFNGLYRVNRKGEFNVPFGRYSNPKICNEENLAAVSEALQGVKLRVADVLKDGLKARAGDLVYFDPPYHPVSPTASFTSYTAKGFGPEQQEQLAELFAALAAKGVHVVLSNSDTPFVRKLFKGFRIEQVFARRAINSRADRRGPVSEVLVSST